MTTRKPTHPKARDPETLRYVARVLRSDAKEARARNCIEDSFVRYLRSKADRFAREARAAAASKERSK